MTRSKIQWTDRSDWNPFRGCTRANEACRNCYAENIAARFSGPDKHGKLMPYTGFAHRVGGDARWTGKVELIADRLTIPLRWKKPVKCFAQSVGDPFHENIPDEDIDKFFAVMALAPHITFQVLTKRWDRMREYCTRLAEGRHYVHSEICRLTCALPGGGFDTNLWKGDLGERAQKAIKSMRGSPGHPDYYLPNVWAGVSVHDQPSANAAIPALLATPAAIRYVSYEPALGSVDFTRLKVPGFTWVNGMLGTAHSGPSTFRQFERGLDWIIAGDESGDGRRPADPDWFRQTRDQCAAAGTAFFLKQMHVDGKRIESPTLDGRTHLEFPKIGGAA